MVARIMIVAVMLGLFSLIDYLLFVGASIPMNFSTVLQALGLTFVYVFIRDGNKEYPNE